MGVVVGSPAHEGDHAGHRYGTESLGAHVNCTLLSGVDIVGGNEHLDFAASGRHRREVVIDDAGTYLTHQPEEQLHALF